MSSTRAVSRTESVRLLAAEGAPFNCDSLVSAELELHYGP
jgi:hypothetical protein